jgi:H+/Cl- antiporter ClcA
MDIKKVNTIALYCLAGLITGAFFAFLFALIFVGVPEQNKDLLNITGGALIGAFTTGVIGYFFGSSAGSKEKNEMINK